MMFQRKCKMCGETKDILLFRVANPARGYIVYKCKSCEKIYNKQQRLKRKPKKTEFKRTLEQRQKDLEYKNKYKEQKLELKISWLEDLYQYIKERNLFTDEELVVIYAWLKMVDLIGGNVKWE